MKKKNLKGKRITVCLPFHVTATTNFNMTDGKENHIIRKYYECGNCEQKIRKNYIYCPTCGRRINWPKIKEATTYHYAYPVEEDFDVQYKEWMYLLREKKIR